MGVQLALLAGCHVVATCGSAAKAERLKGLGVHRVINYKDEVTISMLCCGQCLAPVLLEIKVVSLLPTQDVAEVLRREYPGTIDVAYEGVGGPLRDAVLDSLTPHGR